jgi:hypothetical protein
MKYVFILVMTMVCYYGFMAFMALEAAMQVIAR